MPSTICCFNGCQKPSLPNLEKCSFHRHRLACKIDGCNNIVYARQLCVRHGGKPPCAHSGCQGNARPGGFCHRHTKNQTKRMCSENNCENAAHAKGKCVRHGGGRQCRVSDCSTLARTGGFCRRHLNANIQAPIPIKQEEATWFDSLSFLDTLLLDDMLFHATPTVVDYCAIDLDWTPFV